MTSRNAYASFAILALASCAATEARPARLFEGMGAHTRPTSTRNEEAQRYFDQGLALSYGFNHDEALRSFEQAARLDPSFALAWWGQAYALGPNINMPLDQQHGEHAHAAIQEAIARRAHASPVERDMIDALATRFALPPSSERAHLDRAYADAMAVLWEKYPEDADVGFLYADALMNLAPWDQWTPDFEPKGETPRILATLERVLEIDVNHPGANHFTIHALEASAEPERAEAAADRLGALAPGIGHMVHMPSHIYVQVGRFEDSMRVNDAASRLDRQYFAETGEQGVYHFYHAHNNHFRVWSAMYQGRYEEALESCRLTLADLPDALEADPNAAEWLAMDVHVHLRFGNWQAVLDTPSPREDQPYALAMWRYGRGIAFANTGRSAEARAESEAFEREAARVPVDQVVFIVSALDVLEVARQMLAGEIAYKAGDTELGLEHLRKAVEAEDALRYSEPSPWLMPTRHSLGALLLDQGLLAEAEAVYRHDLRRHPGNVWSLSGLTECLERRGAEAEATAVRAQFERAGAGASVDVQASCYCRPTGAGSPGKSRP